MVALGGSVIRTESAEERDWAASRAWRVCSSRKVGIWRRPRSVSDRQFWSVLSSGFLLVVLGRNGDEDGGNTSTGFQLLHPLLHALQQGNGAFV